MIKVFEKFSSLTVAAIVTLSCAVLSSCVHADKPEYIEISAKIAPTPIEAVPEPSAIDDRLERLDQVLNEGEDSANIVADIRQIILAQKFEIEGKKADALVSWKVALGSAQGRFGKIAFEGWVKSYAQTIEEPVSETVLAKLVLAETGGGRLSPYMTERRLTNPLPLIKRLRTLVPKVIKSEAPEVSEVPGGSAAPPIEDLPPKEPGVPADDILLDATSESKCRSGSAAADAWKRWIALLKPDEKRYFLAISKICGTKDWSGESISSVEADLNELIKTGLSSIRRLFLAEKIVALRRSSGDRAGTATAFRQLIKSWELVDASGARIYGDNDADFLLRHVNSLLWAARYIAIVGDYEVSNEYAKRAITLMDTSTITELRVSQTLDGRVNEYKAEAYHIMAFRVASERREWQKSIAFTTIALNDLKLSDAWRDRLRWYLGLYQYMASNFNAARSAWELLIEESKGDKYRPRAYYWLSRAYEKLGKSDESEFYLRRLNEDHPLSYYSVVAPTLKSTSNVKPWRSIFGDPEVLKQKLKEKQNYSLKIWRNDKTLGQLLKRAEILIAANFGEWARIATREAETYAKKKYAMAKNTERFIYLSRLLYLSGDYFRSIWLTTQLTNSQEKFWQKYPEQILIYFPIPFEQTLRTIASQQGQERALYLSIGRQESSFRPKVVSGAGAIGVMQILPQTAARFDDGEYGLRKVETLLATPTYNIEVGGNYLMALIKRYRGYSPAVFGAYNAGEYMVDTWLERRYFPDPLVWNEMIPFGETNNYIKKVWRNLFIYRYLSTDEPAGLQLSSVR